MKTTTTYIRYYFDRGEWRMTKDRCVLRTGNGLDSAIAAEKELRANGVPVRFMFHRGLKSPQRDKKYIIRCGADAPFLLHYRDIRYNM